jgi:hypothetical protein
MRSRYRADLVKIRAALERALLLEGSVTLYIDSRSALQVLQSRPAERFSMAGRPVHLRWVPSHCGVALNELANSLAKEAAGLDQLEAVVDVQTVSGNAGLAGQLGEGART